MSRIQKIRLASVALTVVLASCLTVISKRHVATPLPLSTGICHQQVAQIPEKNLTLLKTNIVFPTGDLYVQASTEAVGAKWRAFFRTNRLRPELRLLPGVPPVFSIKATKTAAFPMGCLGQLSLGKNLRHNVQVKMGKTNAILDWTGIPLETLEIDAAAGMLKLRFDQQNPSELRTAHIRTGLGMLVVDRMGNARAKTLYLNGAGKYDLDLSGQLDQTLKIYLSGVLRHAILRVPKGAAVWVKSAHHPLARVSVNGKKGIPTDYQSPGFVAGEPHFEIYVGKSIGNIVIIEEAGK